MFSSIPSEGTPRKGRMLNESESIFLHLDSRTVLEHAQSRETTATSLVLPSDVYSWLAEIYFAEPKEKERTMCR